MEFFEGSRRIISKPFGFGQQNLCLCQTLILFGHVLEKFGCLDKVSGSGLCAFDWFLTAMDQVLLRQLKQEISAQADVEIDVALRSLCLGNVEIEGLVEEFDGLFFILFLSPAQNGLEVGVIGRLLVIFTHFDQKLKLLFCVFKLVLLDFAVDHTVEWCLLGLIQL